MDVNRQFAWLPQFFKSRFGIQSPFVIPPLIQPVIDTDQQWPLEIVSEKLTGTLAAGTNDFDFYPGPQPTNTSYGERRHHAIWRWFAVSISVGRAADVYVRDTTLSASVDRLYTGAAAITHYPLVGVISDRRLIQYPYVLRLTITGALATDTYTIYSTRWDRPECDPLRT